jgi:hypothetical protein
MEEWEDISEDISRECAGLEDEEKNDLIVSKDS